MPSPIRTQNCHFATSEGRRLYQEDQVTCDVNLTFPLLGSDGLEDVKVGAVAVFDGHMGCVASEMAANGFLDKLMLKHNSSIEQSSNAKELLKSSLVTTIHDIDAEFSEVALENNIYSGSTAVVALIHDNHVLVANVGDSKVFLCSQKNISHEADAASLGGLFAKELTRDHNAHSSDERARIEASGGVFTFVRNFTPLLNGHFPMTRAIGDVPLKRYGIIADPEITDWLSLTSKDKFLVVSSDGILHRSTPQQVCDFLNEVEDHSDPSLLAQQLIQKAYFHRRLHFYCW
ncbi:putative protein phosphatase 2C 76 isoform X1 [Capsicum annuum]|uniref:putative protein phosphatase 2C 76 isoform X1 n=1 Tax=Capsicum annuum TaxID=4072 RepID=UPI0007BF0039|nr:putative protein phosphatase 2C 76 isoform X1 [Capsicum annuum]XP_016581395.1 putative protein phosphatase 2C 76 isoform X1 [Capsicum annuum]XP_016581396.1 putative protein phosphatase 2C 76 isoform X1 [Capsicum annuum]